MSFSSWFLRGNENVSAAASSHMLILWFRLADALPAASHSFTLIQTSELLQRRTPPYFLLSSKTLDPQGRRGGAMIPSNSRGIKC